MATTTVTLDPDVGISSPQPNALVRGTGITVSGTASCKKTTTNTGTDGVPQEGIPSDAVDSIDKVEVRLGTTGNFVPATLAGTINAATGQQRQWNCTINQISGVVSDSLQITARVTTKPIATGGGPLKTFTDESAITVKVDRTPPALVITTPSVMTEPLVNGTATFVVRGKATDALNAVTAVEWALDGQSPFQPATPKAANNWSEWSASVPIAVAGDHPLAVKARDQERNETTPKLVTLKVALPFLPKDPTDVFGAAAYLDDLLIFAKNRVKVGTTGPALDRQTLATVFHQPFDALTEPANREVANQPVRQVRICIEVLRKYLPSPNKSAAAEASYPQAAYDTLLRVLGTSSEELRLARAADDATRAALAARLGISLTSPRPDQLDRLTLQPDQVTEQDLELLFGLIRTRRDPEVDGLPSQPLLLDWQLARLRALWRQQDGAKRSDFGGPLPIIDSDLINEGDLQPPPPGEESWARALLQARRTEVANQLASIREAREKEKTPLAGFKAVVNQFLCPVDEFETLANRYEQGEDVEPQLEQEQLSLQAFLHLTRIRDPASAGSVLDAEWADVYAILTQVQKIRQYKTWREQEEPKDPKEQQKPLTLGPDHFRLPDADATTPQPPVELPRWRASCSPPRLPPEPLV